MSIQKKQEGSEDWNTKNGIRNKLKSLLCSSFSLPFLTLTMICLPSLSYGHDILFVSDTTYESNIPTVLTNDGHNVTVVTDDFASDNATLASLSPGDYDIVVWVASGSGNGSAHYNSRMFTRLESFVQEGGKVFVTGLNAIANPTDSRLISFIGGSDSLDTADTPGPVINENNSLTTGVTDIRELLPAGYAVDRNTLVGLQRNTIGVVSSGSNWQWTLRYLGYGEIAFVSNGDNSVNGHPSWENTSSTGDGAYNGALRNFAHRSNVGNPRVNFQGGDTVIVDEGTDLRIVAVAWDPQGDPFTYSWDLDSDGLFDDGTGQTVDILGSELDGPLEFDVFVQVCDDTNNCAIRNKQVIVNNILPVFTNIPEEPIQIYVGEQFEFSPDIVDVPLDTIMVLVEGAPDNAVIRADGTIRWTPAEADNNLLCSITFTAQDDDGGEVSATLQLDVILNTPPSVPQFMSPKPGEEVDTLRPTIVVSNPTDEQDHEITLFFEIDTNEQFLQPIVSDNIPVNSTSTATAWEVPIALENNVRHWVKVWASDGKAESTENFIHFWVKDSNLNNGSDADISENDGGVDGDVDGDVNGDGDAGENKDGDTDSETPKNPSTAGGGCRHSSSSKSPRVPILVVIGCLAIFYWKTRKV